MFFRRPTSMPRPDQALPGRPTPLPTADRHHVNGSALRPPYPAGTELATFALGCFWGAEKLFWSLPGVVSTSVGYTGGFTPNPTYEEVCTGLTGHAEAVQVVFDPAAIGYEELLRAFWENHDPTQSMRQGNDVGTQYRSAIFTHTDAQAATATATRDTYQTELRRVGFGRIATEISPAGPYYPAEAYHQQYLAKNPQGYCPDHGTGVSCPIGLGIAAEEPSAAR
jgi:peptide-methionine (S)-S-oxide reductase